MRFGVRVLARPILSGLIAIALCLGPGQGPAAAGDDAVPTAPETMARYVFGLPQTEQVGSYTSVSLGYLPKLDEAGLPRLPIKTAKLLIPLGQRIAKVSVTYDTRVDLEGTYLVEPGQPPSPLSHPGPVSVTAPDPETYDSSAPYPGILHSDYALQMKRGYQVLLLTLYPVQYVPREGKLYYYPSLTVQVGTEPDSAAPSALLRTAPPQRSLDRAEIVGLVDNPEALVSYSGAVQAMGITSPTLNPSPSYRYLIITNQALMSAPGPDNFQALAASKQARGISTLITTTEWIAANYSGARPSGGSDLQTKIRNFITDAYYTWGTEYVLLGGDGDGDGADDGGETGPAIVPHRGLYAGKIFTSDGYVWDNDIPADLYYACLDGSFDHNANGIYGEFTNDGTSKWDGPYGREVDLYAEVYVGRAAVDSAEELSNFVRKTLAYQNEDDPYLRNVWMVGEDLGWSARWGGDRKDDVRDSSSEAGYTTVGFEGSPYAGFFDTHTLYDRDYPGHNWPPSEIIDVINSPAHLINHLGHADTTHVMKLSVADVDTSLDNEHYFIGYSQGCYAGAFDNKTAAGGYSSSDSIAEHLVNGAHGAVAFVGNSRYGWGNSGNAHLGASQYYDRQFWDAVLGEGIFNIGRANQDSKEDTYALIGSGGFDQVMRWVYYELNVLGDPELVVKTSADVLAYAGHTVDDDNSGESSGNADGQVEAGETIEMALTLLSTYGEEVTEVSATLSTGDAYVTLVHPDADYGTIVAGGSAASLAPYVFSVTLSCPDQHQIDFELEISGRVGGREPPETWLGSFRVEVSSEPRIEVSDLAYDRLLQWGAAEIVTLTIGNSGPAALDFALVDGEAGAALLTGSPLVANPPPIPFKGDPDAKTGPPGRQAQSPLSRTAGETPPTAASCDVLLLSPDASAGDISQLLILLEGYPGINVTIWNNSLGEPTATDLSPYCAVIVGNLYMWEGAQLDKDAVGDALADYVDAGGKVIESLYVQSAFDSWGLSGRYISDGYSPFIGASLDHWDADTMNLIEPWHPVMLGVTAIDDYVGHQDPGLASDATMLATWGGTGYPYVAVNDDDNVVALNQLIFSGASWQGDVGDLLYNAIRWLCVADAEWLSEEPTQGTVPAHGSVDVALTLDSSRVTEPGIYHAELSIYSNDPFQPTVNVPVTMTVQEAVQTYTTPTGWGVQVVFGDTVVLYFGHVITEGLTSLVVSPKPDSPGPASTFRVQGPYYHLETTAVFDPAQGIDLTIAYDDSGMLRAGEKALVLLHKVDGQWQDCTVSRDVEANTITGHVSSLGWFALAVDRSIWMRAFMPVGARGYAR